jgi:hypothetical protein
MQFGIYEGIAIAFIVFAVVIGLIMGLNVGGGSPPLVPTPVPMGTPSAPPNETRSVNTPVKTSPGPAAPTGIPAVDFLNMYW